MIKWNDSKKISPPILHLTYAIKSSIKLNEGTNNGAHFMALKAPNAVTASTTLTLPDGAGTDGQFLQTDGSDTHVHHEFPRYHSRHQGCAWSPF